MPKYVDVEALHFPNICIFDMTLHGATVPMVRLVDLQKLVPAADVVEVRHGRWIKDCDRVMGDGWTYTQRHCSECGGQTVECVNYCQFCGAKMDGGQDDV